jgi:hypothetical protein
VFFSPNSVNGSAVARRYRNILFIFITAAAIIEIANGLLCFETIAVVLVDLIALNPQPMADAALRVRRRDRYAGRTCQRRKERWDLNRAHMKLPVSRHVERVSVN